MTPTFAIGCLVPRRMLNDAELDIARAARSFGVPPPRDPPLRLPAGGSDHKFAWDNAKR